jgi:hypothetical protein
MFSAPAETACFRGDAGAAFSSCAGTVDSLSSLRRFVVPGFEWTAAEGGDGDRDWEWERAWDKGCWRLVCVRGAFFSSGLHLPRVCAASGERLLVGGERLLVGEVRDGGEDAWAIRRDGGEGLGSESAKRTARAPPVSVVVSARRP